ncbi:CDP-diacylglycerol--glycerol-3-phosphate 3-phosphatidyltransferase [Hasllibacter halocynthiae]|uniref:CDP-diacylglycerol--glycerol-3-phosphate 3-phosphatidyltransferase n=1 Tax=Hasllibacter halocynthiae TaxID=595589 RepID=A0A2T0X3S8_9RHOB|nr:CDP-diacylglycerol--glycerol-3-phosphate 3-phosphatidyltransferase [Hasllibacter halocynthiae]PRY93590.1 CDP-diacylglycerol--glycerol-3-phosphate 3-phosphatidyltransferase [Hasllibacter halocynthiae]
MKWNLPNVLTFGRLVAAPALPLAYVLLPAPWADLVGLILFSAAAITDYVDGQLARRWGQVSRFGAMLDPIADKAMVVTAVAILFGLYGLDLAIVVPATLILFREVFVSGLREFLGADAGKLAVTRLAKWKTTAQLVSIGFLLAARMFEGALGLQIDAAEARGALEELPFLVDATAWLATATFWIGLALFWVAGILTAVTGWDYFAKARPFLTEAP